MAEKINIIELDINSQDVVKKLSDINLKMVELKNTTSVTYEEVEINKAKLKALGQEYQNTQKVLVQLTQSETQELGTLQKLALSNKTLRAEQQKLNLTTAEGVKRNKEIVKEIDANTASIRANSDENVRNKMNVGNYGASVESAMKGIGAGMLAAAGPVALVTGAFNKLKDAFFETEGGAKVVKQWTETVKTYFQSLVTGYGSAGAAANSAGALQVAKKMDEMRKGDREDVAKIAEMEAEIQRLRLESVDASKSVTEQKDLLIQAEAKESELIKFKVDDLKEELLLTNAMLVFRGEDTALLDKQAELPAQIISIESSASLKIAAKKSALTEKELADNQKIADEKARTNAANEKAVTDEANRKAEAAYAANQNVIKEEMAMRDALAELDNEIFANFAEGMEDRKQLDKETVDAISAYKAEKAEYDKAIEVEKKEATLQVMSELTGSLAELFGKQTKLGKAAAIAETAINTYASATAAFKSLAGIPVVGPALGAVAAGAAIVSGLANVKKILAVKSGLPGGDVGGGSAISGGSVSVSVPKPTPAQLSYAGNDVLTSRSNNGNYDNSVSQAQNILVVDRVTAKQNSQRRVVEAAIA